MNISRVVDIINARKFCETIMIVGCGTTGSRLAELLNSVGFGKNMILADHDRVSESNLCSQLYEYSDVDLNLQKVYATARKLNVKHRDSYPIRVSTHKQPKNRMDEVDIICMCVDSMLDRRKIVESAYLNGRTKYVLDIRISAHAIIAVMFDIRMHNQYNQYLNEWYPDPDPEADAAMGGCNITPSVAPTASIAAGIGAWLLIDFLNGEFDVNEITLDVRTWESTKRSYT